MNLSKLDISNAVITDGRLSGEELYQSACPGTSHYTLSGDTVYMVPALMYGFRMRRRERRLKNGL